MTNYTRKPIPSRLRIQPINPFLLIKIKIVQVADF